MKWFNGIGLGWAGCFQEFLVMVVLWGTVITAILAVHYLAKQRSDPLALRNTGSLRIEYVLPDGSAHGEKDSDQWLPERSSRG